MSSVIPSQPQDRVFSANYPRSSLYSGGLSKYYQPLFLSAEIDQILSSSSLSHGETYSETDEDDLFNFNLTFSFDGELESLENEDSVDPSLSNSFDSIHRSVGKATNALERAFTDAISADSYSKSLGKDDRESYQHYWNNGLTRYSGGILPLWDETDLDEQIDSIQSEIAKVSEERRLLHKENNPVVNTPSQSQDSTPVSSPVSLSHSSSTSSLSSIASLSPVGISSNNVVVKKEKKPSSTKRSNIVTVSPLKDSKQSNSTKSHSSTPSFSPSSSSVTSPLSNVKRIKIVSNNTQKNPSILNQRTQIEKTEEPSEDLVLLDIIDTDQLSASTPSSTNRSKVSGYCIPISPSSNASSGAESPNSSQDERPFYSSEEAATTRSSFYPSQHKTTSHLSPSASISKRNTPIVHQGLYHQQPLNNSVLNNSKKRISTVQQETFSHSSISNSKRARTKQVSEIFRLEQVHKVQSSSPDDEDEEIDIL